MAETRILIVDDEKMESILMEKCVNWVPYGFRVVGSVQTAHDALTGLVTFSPDLVFCSIGMLYTPSYFSILPQEESFSLYAKCTDKSTNGA